RRTRSGEVTRLQHRHLAFARATVAEPTSDSFFGSKTSNSTRDIFLSVFTTLQRRARLRFGFLLSQNERISGISAPQLSQVIVLAQRYTIGVPPFRSTG